MAQGIAYQCSKVECEDHLAIQVPKIQYLVMYLYTEVTALLHTLLYDVPTNP